MGIGGDYASVHFQDDQHLVVGICDVSGHGVASALLANRVNSFVLSQAPHVRHPCQLVEALNDFVFRTFHETGLYLTFFSLFIDLDSRPWLEPDADIPRAAFHQTRQDRQSTGL